jgi:hypothetical protein
MAPAIPQAYQIFFLWVEPIATLVGAFYAGVRPLEYLYRTHAVSNPERLLGLPIATQVVLQQLGNMYLAFALNEALVLRATTDLQSWNAIHYGNYLFVYVGATFRTCFLLGVGFGAGKKAKRAARKSIKTAEEDFAALTPSPAQMTKTPAQSTRRRKNKSVSGS